MRFLPTLKALTRFLAWALGVIVVLALVWFAANRLTDEHLDPRRDAFVRSGGPEVPDDRNIAVGVAGLSAPRGADFMKFGADITRMYERYAPWQETYEKAHGADELKLTVEWDQITCWTDPETLAMRSCLPFEKAPQVLAENRELLDRYRHLLALDSNVGSGLGNPGAILISLTKLAVAEMRLDMKNANYEAAYAKWRASFRFARTFVHGQTDWVGKMVGMVNVGLCLIVIEDLLVKKPSLARAHYQELTELLRPEGIELIDPSALAIGQYLQFEYSVKLTLVDRNLVNQLGQKLVQWNRLQNRYLAFSMDYPKALRQPWDRLPQELPRLREQYSPGWEAVVDPFGSMLFLISTDYQTKLTPSIRQVYNLDGRLRLETLVVRIIRDGVKDPDIPAYLAKAQPPFRDPFGSKPMLWSPEHGQLYFLSGEKNCDVIAVRVPAWNPKGKRLQPKNEWWTAC